MKFENIMLCMGTRPEIIKMAPVYYALKAKGLSPLLLHTGQHKDMADPMYQFFNIIPDFSLQLVRVSDTLSHLSALMLDKLGDALSVVRPPAVLVHGDTSSAAMAALAAFYQQITVGHVEAGLRSHQGFNPFPEEKNRELIARLATWHFAPTARARENLLKENVPDESIHVIGNTIVDAVRLANTELRDTVAHAREIESGPLKLLAQRLTPERRLILITAHRRENLGRPLLSITRAVRELLESEPDIVVVWPVHSNPKIHVTVNEVFAGLPADLSERLFLTRPLSYPMTINLLKQAWMVLTDSGGIQEEAACMQVPVLILRETTERQELVDSGGGRLIGTRHKSIVAATRALLRNPAGHQAMRGAPNPFGDGYAAARIHDVLIGGTHAP
jgi:UDP-N-acetylglucosamine 2-epimerase